MGHSAFPLEWPEGQPRHNGPRCSSKFRKLGFAACAKDLQAEIDKLGGYNATLSTAIPLRMDGTPKLRETNGTTVRVDDPGAAVYFTRRHYRGRQPIEKHYAVACDQYHSTVENIRALVHTIEAMRTIDRHGASNLLEQALSGFAALPPAAEKDPWWRVLGFTARPSLESAKARYRELAVANHPDKGGSADRMASINAAIREAESEATT